MNRDPWSNHQVRFERGLHNPDPISGPFNSSPLTSYGDLAVGIVAAIIAILAIFGVIA